jgi:DNA polymerase III subunit alpha
MITMFSLLDGLSKASDIAKRCLELHYTACALTEHGNVSGIPSFIKELSECKIKAIAGCEFYVSKDTSLNKEKTNGLHSHLCVLAKGQQGWKNLIKAVSTSNRPERFYKKPRLSLEEIGSFAQGEFVTFSGHMGSDMANVLFEQPKLAYGARTYAEAEALLDKEWELRSKELLERFTSYFGRANFFMEIQRIDGDNLPAALVVADKLRWLAEREGIPAIATADSHYCRREDAGDQRVLLCASLNTTLKEVYRKIDADEDVGLGAFFKSNRYHIPSYDEMRELHTEAELKNTVLIAESCATPKIASKPKLPKFDIPKGYESSFEYLKDLCRKGWKKKLKLKPEEITQYKERVERELKVIKAAKLSDYFLITEDYINYAKSKGIRVNKGRGSSCGSLVSHLVDITDLDPIKAKLSFERFYSSSRLVPEHVSFEESPFDKFSVE